MKDPEQHLKTIGKVLFAHHQLWRCRPFYSTELVWKSIYPALYNELIKLSDLEFDALNTSDQALRDFVQHFVPDTHIFETCDFNDLPQHDAPQRYSPSEHAGIAGRKWEQIKAFTACLRGHSAGVGQPKLFPIIDWCSGKGHLAKMLSSTFNLPIQCLEYDKALCESGQALAKKQNLPVRFLCQDVLQPIPSELLTKDTHHCALHACGQLHISLLEQVSSAGVAELSFSPCCYHKINTTNYSPLSSDAVAQLANVDFLLTKQDIQLATEESVTGGKRGLRLRERERLWRVVFDLIQRDIRGVNEYLPVPSIRESLLSGELLDFCRWAAIKKQIELPKGLSPESYLEVAQSRLQKIRRLELPRQVFREPLEKWLILDRVRFLEERGYRVTVGRFCKKTVTPRNYLLLAQRV